MSTIHDVAQRAGVSIATVSRVLQGSPNVSPNTRNRINEAIEELDYHPNKLAQNFRTQKTNNILVILPEMGNTFYTEILAGIESVVNNQGYRILVVSSHGQPALEASLYSILEEKQVDGIITFSASLPAEVMHQYAKQYPVVMACRKLQNGSLPNVAIDNEKASFDIVNYLLNLGHKRFCYLAGPSALPLYNDRLLGFRKALAIRNTAVDESLILRCEPTIQSGYDNVTKLLNSGASFSALVAGGDTLAIGAIRALNRFGRSVPSECAVVGFDDIELSSIFSPSLTTVRQPQRQMGIRSAEQLLNIIGGAKPTFCTEILNYELVIRESSGDFRPE